MSGEQVELLQLHADEREVLQAPVQVTIEDCILLEDARRRLNDVRQRLGDERMAYLARETELCAAATAAGDAYEQLVGAFASKYIHQPGRYSFRADVGAFVLIDNEAPGEAIGGRE